MIGFIRARADRTAGRPGRRTLLTFVALAGGLSATLLTTGSAYGVTGCRGDPLVTLSNGISVRLVAQIGTATSSVNAVNFTLHIPKGTTVASVQYDGLLPETLSWVADKAAMDSKGDASFTDVVSVQTSTSNVQTTISATTTNGTVENYNQQSGSSNSSIKQDFQYQPGSNSTCQGDATLTGQATGGLTVPSGVTCNVTNLTLGGPLTVQPGGVLNASNLSVAQTVTVQSGSVSGVMQYAQLNASGLTVNGDLKVPAGGTVNIDGATLNGNLNLTKLTGANSICSATVSKALTVSGDVNGSTLSVGNGSSGCGGNTIAQNAQIQNNLGTVTVSGNGFKQDLTCSADTSLSVSSNQVAGTNKC